MKEITREEFKNERAALEAADKKFDVKSVDCGSIQLSMHDCYVVASNDGLFDEIIIGKPYTNMEVTIDFDIIDAIYREENTYTLEFNNGMPDIEITVTEE
ncbi:hypothetical protein [Anaerotignum sp.]